LVDAVMPLGSEALISRKRKERHNKREHEQRNQRDGEEASHGVRRDADSVRWL